MSFTVGHGSTMALVGESGAGETTIGRAVVRIQPVTSGTIRFKGGGPAGVGEIGSSPKGREFQMIFQDPFGSLDPRQTVGNILAEPLAIHGLASPRERPTRVRELLSLVGLDPASRADTRASSAVCSASGSGSPGRSLSTRI